MELLTFVTWYYATHVALSLVAWLLGTIAYRLFFHPLAKVPGPKIASVTRLYLFYYNSMKDGTLYLQIEKLHEIYGMTDPYPRAIVRIAPNEIHLSDPENYDRIYTIGSKFDKDPVFYSALGTDNTFAISSNVIHRQMRAPLNPFFSRRAILDLEDMVHGKVESLCRVLENCMEHGLAMNLHDGYRAIAVDIVTGYAFDESWDHLDEPDFGRWFSEMVKNSGRTFWILQQFPFVRTLMMAMPEWFAGRMSPTIADMLHTKLKAKKHVQAVQDNINQGVKPGRRTIFHNLLDPELIAGSNVPTVDDMAGEAFSMCVAASDTTGNALTTATYQLIRNTKIYGLVKGELRRAFPDPNQRFPYATLEKLPYLTGVVKEAQRLSYGIVSRMPRIVPPGGDTFDGYLVPGGTVVSMSAYLMHRNQDVFPDPDVFDPTRWINQPPEVLRARERCFVPFARGSRMCLGQNLAMCELYITLGTIFRRYEGFDAPDIGPLTYADYFNVFSPEDAQPLKEFNAQRVTS